MLQRKSLVLTFLLVFIHQFAIIESLLISKNLTKRAVSTIPSDRIWKDGIVPYKLHSNVSQHKCLIESAMLHIMMRSCVHFRPYDQSADKHFFWIHRGDGCSAHMGQFSYSKMSLGEGCYDFGTILHELMHVLGFDHEHQRSDRDQYLKINFGNIINPTKNREQFTLNQKKSEEIFLTKFDFDSITIYGSATGRINRKRPTIESKVPGKLVKSSKEKFGLSKLDVKSINKLYNCPLKCEPWKKYFIMQNYLTNCEQIAAKNKYFRVDLNKALRGKYC